MPVQLIDEEQQIEIKDSELEDISDGDPATVYVIRQIPPAMNRQIAKRHTTTPINRRSGQRETVVDQLAVFDDLLDYALVNWRGIQHKGQDVPCTRDFKLLLDVQRKVALVQRAGQNQVAEVREQSFRKPA
jgi:hypothetical protein